MKKLVSVLLTLTLLLALAVPAAAELTPPLWEQIGYESLEECLEYEMISAGQYESIAAEAERFDAYVFYNENSIEYYGSAQEYMEYMELTEEDFYSWMLYDWFLSEAQAYYEQNQKDQLIESVGGVPGQINVMFNGVCVPFPDTVPEIVSGRTMIPLRSVMEALDCEVLYDHPARLAQVEGEGISFSHYIGTNVITLSDGASVEMDVASYIQGGRTMVPLRFFSQALGYDVYWDSYLRTAVVLDRETVVEKINENFTVLNSLIKEQGEVDTAKNYQGNMDFSGSARVYDTINGDAAYSLSGEFDMHYNQQTINLDGKLDLSAVTALLEELGEEQGEALPAGLLDLLSDFSFQAIIHGASTYISAPLLSYALEAQGYSLPDTFWVSMDLGGAVSVMEGEMMEIASIGDLLYESALAGSGDDTFGLYQKLGEMSDMFTIMMGDDTFTKSGSSYKWHFGEKEYMALVQRMYGDSSTLEEEGVSEFSVDMTLRPNGSADFSMVVAASDTATGATAVRMEMEGSSTNTTANFIGKLQLRNICDVTFALNMTNRETAKAPMTEPPAGELVIDGNFPNIPVE